MHLFRCGNAKPAGVPAPTTLNTPLGAVRFDAVLDGESMADEAPTRMHQLVAGGRLVCWHRQEFDLELLVCRPVPSRSSQKGLTDCWAGLWRLRAQTTIASCTFTAVWEEGYTWLGGGPDTGQGLYAKTWEDGQTEVSIGTEDEQALATRSHQLSVLKILLKHGAKVNVAHQAPPGGIILGQAVPPLPLAAEGGNVAMLRMLLEVGARTDSRDPGKGDTALIVATRHGNLAAVKLLLSKNADRHLKNKNAESALSIA